MFGIIMAILSLLFMTHIFCYIVSLKVNKIPSNAFLNNMLVRMENSQVMFAVIPTFILLCYYFLFVAHKGSVALGMRFFFVSFYPI